jgi:hypothetical protein
VTGEHQEDTTMTDPTPGVPDHAPPRAETNGLSPKAIASTAVCYKNIRAHES